jgi:large subunit ribosomal protein L21
MYAIVRTGGKQYRVEEGRSLEVERLPAAEGETVELGDVLLIEQDGSVTIGRPTIEGARVLAHVDANGRAKKIIIFTYKNKVRTRSKTGHRQSFTRLTVEEILLPGQEAKAKPKRARKAKAAEEAEVEMPEAEAPEVEAEAIAEPVAEAPVVEEAPKPRVRRAAPKAAKAPPAKAAKAPAKAEKPKKAPRGKAEAKKDEKKPARRRILRRKKED